MRRSLIGFGFGASCARAAAASGSSEATNNVRSERDMGGSSIPVAHAHDMVMAGAGQSRVRLACDGAATEDALIPLQSDEKSSAGARSFANTWSFQARGRCAERSRL